ncbi:MAG: acetolactate synthase small subunit [Syntrophomonas sp.]|jgi:acetolactate synthase-1/3 small subunit|uniref:Acetolactate synthase small subunit n=1 Tax=Syntrophomonas wolfei subsp. wolfei (strain DSM 2245B / Goettingen) TaxID=335541 RepID=Q0AV18_SYNWW|nr:MULTISPECIES: acetolactate synthase small subunit [Syntrophomonas]ABI69436.1 acetolactate synthase, small subunit [Syntrophomonas wolfei subsp. wolfei str. Goettingen G311]MDD2510793.1 acetolactate synthase small subunit [Syntrophomonas sp.]MDD3880497.1 acetolactate synthase small subunit [Syntrophomonas sp.]MDD4627212.1 acetolactate synthase small subunit [Syntrophomonas sp.]
MKKHTLAVTVENRPGVLTRVTTMFRRRGYNIESLAVGATENPAISRITIEVTGDDRIIEQVTKQLYKLIEVIKINDLTDARSVDRELVLIKVKADNSVRAEIVQIVDIFRARIVDIGRDSLIIEVTGDSRKIEAIEDSLRAFGIIEMVRTGKIAMIRGGK